MRKAPSQKTVKMLFAASGGVCAFPRCMNRLVDRTSGALLGEMCHISAVSEGGPRFDPLQSGSDGNQTDNLILLCPTHHSLIDQAPDQYSSDVLRTMKAEHEERITKATSGESSSLEERQATDLARQATDIGVDFAIVTALPVELDALRRYFPELQHRNLDATQSRSYYAGDVPTAFGGKYKIVATLLHSMGNLEAAHATADLVHKWNPRFILVNGIAGGLRPGNQEFGDVVVSESIVYYELGKIRANELEPRNRQFPADRSLLDGMLNLTTSDWRIRLPARPDGKTSNTTIPKVHFGPIASGEKIIASGHQVRRLLTMQPNLVAVEMESAGIASAAFSAVKKVGFLTIRAICDFADSSKNDNWQEYAAHAAASCLRALLAGRPVGPSDAVWPGTTLPRTKPADPTEHRHRIFENLCAAVDMEEFKNFCFLLGVEIDELPGDRKSSRVRELILLFERRNRVAVLDAAVDELINEDEA